MKCFKRITNQLEFVGLVASAQRPDDFAQAISRVINCGVSATALTLPKCSPQDSNPSNNLSCHQDLTFNRHQDLSSLVGAQLLAAAS